MRCRREAGRERTKCKNHSQQKQHNPKNNNVRACLHATAQSTHAPPTTRRCGVNAVCEPQPCLVWCFGGPSSPHMSSSDDQTPGSPPAPPRKQYVRGLPTTAICNPTIINHSPTIRHRADTSIFYCETRPECVLAKMCQTVSRSEGSCHGSPPQTNTGRHASQASHPQACKREHTGANTDVCLSKGLDLCVLLR